jgi:hypothetical protein
MSHNKNKRTKEDKDTISFVKQKLDSARWFIDAIIQRQNTLLLTMNAIIDYQKEYFAEGDETKLRPMILKNIAEKTGLDISTISRVANSKYIQTHFGIFPLKSFFSEGLQSDSGEEVSTREIKNILADCISKEDKRKPLTDEKLVVHPQTKGIQHSTADSCQIQGAAQYTRCTAEKGTLTSLKTLFMQIITARIISVMFHPLIMPAAGILLLFNSGTYLEFLTFEQKRAIFLILLTGTAILPLSIIPVILLNRMNGNLKMEYGRERVVPLLITFLFYGFTWYMMKRLNVPGLVNLYAIAAGLTVLICALVSITWKISLHMVALGALAGMILAIAMRFGVDLQLYLSVIFLIGGITGWARLTLKAHTPIQVYLGYLSGAAVAFFVMFGF